MRIVRLFGVVAAIVYGLFFSLVGWRGLFVIGALPAFLVLYIRMKVPESPAWERTRHVKVDHFVEGRPVLARNLPKPGQTRLRKESFLLPR